MLLSISIQKLHWRTTVVLLQGHSILKNWQFDCLLQQWPGLYKLLKDLWSRHSSTWCASIQFMNMAGLLHWSLAPARISRSNCHAQNIMQQLPCPGHHAATAMARISCSNCYAQDIVQQLPCPGHCAATAMPRASCSNCHVQDITQQLPCPGHHQRSSMFSCSNVLFI